MKLLLLMYTGSDPGRVTALLDLQPVEGYTELGPARGAGRTGRHLGTRAFPGSSAVFFSIVEDGAAATVTRALSEAAEGFPPGERLHVAVLPVEYAA